MELRGDPAGERRASASRGSSFHYSFGLLPRDQRRGIETVYAFCRAVDDLADESALSPEAAARELQSYREEIDRCYGGRPTRPVTIALKGCIDRFGVERRPLDDLLDGVQMDLHTRRYRSFEDLRLYCYRVASTVGLVCLSIFGCRHPKSRDYAVELGIALQLTNILRDIRSDAERGRIYLPLDEIAASGYSEAELLAGVRSAAWDSLMRLQVDRARRQFARAAALLPEADRRRLLAAEVMAAIYRRLLRRLEEGGFQMFARPVRVPRLQQIGVALRAYLTGHVGE